MDKNTQKYINNLRPQFEEQNGIVNKKLQQKFAKEWKKAKLPNKKNENWTHTPLNSIQETNWKIYKNKEKQNIDLTKAEIPNLNSIKIVTLDGKYMPLLSDKTEEKGLFISEIKSATKRAETYLNKTITDKDKSIFLLQNMAFAEDGLFIEIEENRKIEKTIYLININTNCCENKLTQTHNLFIINKNSKARIIETFISDTEEAEGEKYFANNITEIFVAENANLSINTKQKVNEQTNIFNHVNIEQEKYSFFKQNIFSLSANLIRNEIKLEQKGEDSDSSINGLAIPKKKQIFDNVTIVKHHKADGRSYQTFRHIVEDAATANFNGIVYVMPDAQKTDAYQSNKNVLLTNKASANSRPKLEIYADDVKCSHGSTTGQIDKEAVFYLRTRGIGKKTAESLVLLAFAREVLKFIDEEICQEMMYKEIEKYFII